MISRGLKYTRQKVTAADLFPTQIMLRYKDKSSYQTFCGGILSIVICVITLIISIAFFIVLVKKSSLNVNQTKSFKELLFDDTKYHIFQDDGYMIATKIQTIGENIENALEYVKVDLYQINIELGSEDDFLGNRSQVGTRLQMVPCTKNHFKGIDDAVFEAHDLSSYQ